MKKLVKAKWLGLVVAVAVVTIPLVLRAKSAGDGRPVDMQKLEARDIQPTILASGMLTYRTSVDLTSELTAKVVEELVHEGDDIKAGQIVLRLDPSIYRNEVERDGAARSEQLVAIERQQVELQLRRNQFARTQKQFDAHIVSQAKYDDDKSALNLAEVGLKSAQSALIASNAVLAEAKQQLGKTDVRAPIGGRVVALPIKVGETAIPSTMSLAGAKLATIADTSTIQAELKVDEVDIGRVSLDQAVDVYPAAWPDRALRGTVVKIALWSSTEGSSQSYKVTVQLQVPADLRNRAGMSCRAEIKLGDGKPRLAVPVEALLTDDDEHTGAAANAEPSKPLLQLVVVRDGRAHKMGVTAGTSDDRWRAVTAPGLKGGDLIVVGPNRALHEIAEGEKLISSPKVVPGASHGKESS